MLRLSQICVDAHDPERLGAWWAGVLGWPLRVDADGDAFVTPPPGQGSELLFLAVPEDKVVKNRLHLDFTPDDQQAEVAAQYILKHYKDKRVAVVYDKNTYGTGLANNLKATLNKGGVKEVVDQGINAGEKDYSALITRLKSEKADVIYFGGYHPEGGLIARQLADQGIKAQIIGAEGLSNTEYWAIGGAAAAGTLFTNSADPTKNPSAAKIMEALKAKNIPAEAFTLNAYAALQVIKAGIEKAGSADPAAVAAALHSGAPVSTVVGDLTYAKTGDLTTPTFVLYKWEDGKAAEVK